MKKVRVSANLTVFLLFFGTILLEAIQNGNWLVALFWFAISIIFLAGDNIKKELEQRKPQP